MTDFEKLYEQYFKDVYLFILSMSCNDSIAEEITQETFFKVLKHLDDFRGTCSVKVWLCQIAKNTCFSHLKKQKNLVYSAQCVEAVSPDIEDTYIQKDEALSIYKVLHYLEDPYKEVFTLRVLGSLSFREIGEIFGRKEGWARVTFHRAKCRIQDMIQEELHEKNRV